jgi:integrase
MPSPNIKNQLKGLWVGFVAYKSGFLHPNTIEKDYGRKTKIIDSIPTYATTARDIIDWLETRYATDTARRVIQRFIECYEWGIRTDRVQVNAFTKYSKHFPKKSNDQRKAFTAAERGIILEAFRLRSPHFYPFVNFCFRTGCRHEEARGLEWKNVKSDHIHFCQAIATGTTTPAPLKTNDTRNFPLTPKIREIIDTQRGLAPRWVFPSLEGDTMDSQNFNNRHWKPIVEGLFKRGQIDQCLPPKHTRHTFITISLRDGMEVTDIAALSGNSATTIWKHYAAAAKEIQIQDF